VGQAVSESRVALITGGGRGLGREMALALLAAGHRVVLSSTDSASLAAVAEESGAADRVATVVADLARAGEAERLADAATRPFGRIDVLINNAGVGTSDIRSDALERPYRFWESDRAVIERFFAINSISSLILAIRLVPKMIERGWGRIVSNTTSLDTMLRFSLYGGSKAALEAETAVMSKDLEGSGVTANVLIPGGGTGSRMTDRMGIPRSVLHPPEIMRAPIVFLASDASNGFSGRRVIAIRWRAELLPAQAAQEASDPIAWTGFGAAGVQPAVAREKPVLR
jgi:NAD(P)-dependent dehydrogenase (short-subunit alcohol dehydrogenase family)